MRAAGRSGVVVDVRFWPYRGRLECRGWRTVRVRVGSKSKRFTNLRKHRLPMVVDLEPGKVVVRADNEAENPEYVEEEIELEAGAVAIVAVYPCLLGWLLPLRRPARIDVIMLEALR